MIDFDPSGLPLDSERMLAGLRAWVECESPSWDTAAVNRMMDLASLDIAALGGMVERIPGVSGFGDFVRARLPHPARDAPGILILGHFDTVHPIGTLPWRRDGDRCYGPGILDMKSGNYLALEALRQLQTAGIPTHLPVSLLFTSDEEVGSQMSRGLIEAEARRNKYVLVPEPARPDGGVVTGRHAIARFNLTTTGRPSHAGHGPEKGVSAIREMAEKVLAIEDMSGGEVSCSVGVIRGGQWSNCVPTRCTAELLIMAKSDSALEDLIGRVRALAPHRQGSNFLVEPGPRRPIWKEDALSTSLYDQARAIAKDLGFDLSSTVSGGGSDGNFTGHIGIATLDGLGACGASLHTDQEHIVVASLAERGRLFAGLLATLR